MTDDDLLTPRPPAANDALRAAVLDQTTRRLRLARRARLMARVGLCVTCFAAGLGTALLRPAPEPQVVYVPVREELPAAVKTENKDESPPPRAIARSPAELELEAEQALVRAESARLFREAGDRYLREYADYRAALRCYRNSLDADPVALTISPDDTWLLTSLKRARAQESMQ